MVLAAGVLAVVTVRCFTAEFSFLYTQIDVGQGDCACVFVGEKTYLIDGGSSSENEVGMVIQKFLKFYGRTRIDGIFVTHSDADHTSGIRELVSSQEEWGFDIRCIIMPEIEKKDDGYNALCTEFAENNTDVLYMKKGEKIENGDLTITCLHPESDYEWTSENDYSLTLELSFRKLRILTTGDLEEDGEDSLGTLKGGYDVLKVGHHGSKTSTSESFLEMVSPKNAIISVGANNYGHPAPVTLEKLETAGTNIWSTRDSGAVFVSERDGKVLMEGFCQ